MTVHYQTDQITILHDDCLTALRAMPDESVHAVVTDPPYGLANTDPKHVVDALTRWAAGDREFIPEGKGFMGKAWDASVPPPAVWDECMRVLKPGGHLLAFAGSRTFDLMTLSIRFAGFDIRDSIAWLYGSGFPKSMDVAKAIDKSRTDHDEIEVVRSFLNAARRDRGIDLKSINQRFGFADNGGGVASAWTTNRTSRATPTWEQWMSLKEWLGFGGEVDDIVRQLEETRLGGTDAWNARPPMLLTTRPGMATSWSDGVGWSGKDARGGSAVREDAKKWEGWGTALKPAFEPVVVARKPFSGTVATNVLEHGTGALNIDATRVGMSENDRSAAQVPMRGVSPAKFDQPASRGADRFEPAAGGRWPANVMLDESQAAELDKQSGTLTSGSNAVRRKAGTFLEHGGLGKPGDVQTTYGDSGGASRFFYVAKAPSSERPEVEGTMHATVKPLDLMQRLIRLVTPPGGTVLEPFAGSGTTAEAALREGFHCIAIEREAGYLPLIMQRIQKDHEQSLFGSWDGAA